MSEERARQAWKDLAGVVSSVGKNPLSVDGSQLECLDSKFYTVRYPVGDRVLELYYGDVNGNGVAHPDLGSFIDIKYLKEKRIEKSAIYRWESLSKMDFEGLKNALEIANNMRHVPHPESYLRSEKKK